MEYDNYDTLTTVPATDCNFTVALGYASHDELLRAQFHMENHPAGNKCVAEWCETIPVSQYTVYHWIRTKGATYAERRLSEIA